MGRGEGLKMADNETKYIFILEGEEFIKAVEERGKKLEPLAEDRIKLALLTNLLAEERNLLAYLRNQFSQKRTELSGERTELARDRTELSKHRTELSERRTKLSQDRSKRSEMSSRMAEVRTRMSGARTGLAQSRTNLAQYRTILAKQRTELSYLRTGLTLIAIGTVFTRMFGLGYWSIIDGIILLTGIGSIGMAIKLFLKSFFVERKLLVQLEEELAPEAVKKRMEEAIQSYRFGAF
jgi:uncharacterized membrane protein YidH (DUF202 family)